MSAAALFSHFITVKRRRIPVLNRRGKLKRSRAGRPANPHALRDVSGKSRGETVENIMAVALQQPHRRGLSLKDRSDSKAGYPLGRLLVDRRITAVEYAAGDSYAKIFSRYAASIGAPNPDTAPRPGSGEDLSREECKRRKEAYDAVFECMTTREAKEVARVAIHQRQWESVLDLRCGLQKIALKLGLTRPHEYAMAK